MNGFQVISSSEEETREIAAILSPLFRAGDMIVLDGELGAGKTRFVKGFAAARGSADPVTSPTFSIANFYRAATGEILHVDLYRVETPGEYADLGLADYFPRAVVLVEWGLKFPAYLEDHLLVTFARGGMEAGRRRLTFEGRGARYAALLEEIKPRLSSFRPC
jgi:tRNA threonylcarbamoyladenosine biosynthesis protein TsaE